MCSLVSQIQARCSSDSLVKRARWLRQVEILASLSQRQLALLAGVLKAVTFSSNELIIQQGDVGDTFYIVEEGSVSCRVEGMSHTIVLEVATSAKKSLTFMQLDRECGKAGLGKMDQRY